MDNSIKEIVSFWNQKNFKPGTKIHETDYELLKNQLFNECKNFSDYISNYIDSDDGKDKKFHPHLLPCPYCGDLKNGEIFILSLNPGFSCDYFYEENKEFKNALVNNLKQENLDSDYPMLYLNPKFSWTSGGMYWLKKLGSLIDVIKKNKNCSYTEALKFLSKKIVLLEIVPYHSKTFSFAKYKDFGSVKAMSRFLNDYVVKKAEKEKALLIVLRKGKDLKDKDLLKFTAHNMNVIIYEKHDCQSASLSEESNGGESIIRFLKIGEKLKSSMVKI